MVTLPPVPPCAAASARVVVEEGRPPAVSVAGPADRVLGRPAAGTTPFHLCSAAKAVTTVGVLRLAARGVVDLDADVRELVPLEVPGRRGPTLRQLLGHGGGIVDPPGSFEPHRRPAPSIVEVLAGATSAHPGPVRVVTEPGTGFSYSDAGYCVVERAVEVATGDTFAAVLQREVATPLGLTATGFWAGATADADGDEATAGAAAGAAGATEASGARDGAPLRRLSAAAAAGHHADGQRVAGGRAHYAGLAASGLWAAPADLAVLLADVGRALDGRGGVLLAPDQASALRHDPGGLGVGLGVFLLGTPARPCVMTQGWGVGFQCQLRWYPGARGAVAVVVNHDPGVPQEESVVGASVLAAVDSRRWR